MSIYDKSSLVLIPSGTKTGTVFSQKPVNGDGDFTFTRASAATRVGADGFIEKETSNLLLQSNTFSDAAWNKSSILQPTNGYEGYDGSSNAWKLVPNTSSSSHIRQSLSTTGIITTTIYAKAAEWNYVGLYFFGSNKGVVWSLIDGSIQNPIVSYPEIYSNGESIGNGWWKFSMTHNVASGDFRIWPCEQNIYNGNTPDGVSGIYIQDAQLNQGLVTQPYQETTTTAVYGGITDNTPRLDYTDSSCPALLLEPLRTNLITQSEYITGGLNTNECTQIITTETNPSGNNVSYLTSAIDATNDQMRYNINVLSSESYFLSAFVKGNGITNKLRFRGTGGGISVGNVYWDVASDGTISLNISESPSGVNAITESYGNGWYRIGYEETYDGSSIGRFAIYPSSGDVNASTYLWGVQIEQGSYPTSYIPTYGTSVTRLAEDFVDKIINYGSVFSAVFDIDILGAKDANNFLIKIGQTNSIYLSVRRQDKKIQFYSAVSGVGYFATPASKKIAISCDGTNWIWASDGTSGTLTATGVPNAANIRVRTSGSAGGGLPSVELNKMLLFNTALNANELVTLTTI